MGLVDFNVVMIGDFDVLLGVGLVIVVAIVGYRDKYGLFCFVDGFGDVLGIGLVKLVVLCDLVCM